MGSSCMSKKPHPAVHAVCVSHWPLTGETHRLWGENMLRPLSHKVWHFSFMCVFYKTASHFNHCCNCCNKPLSPMLAYWEMTYLLVQATHYTMNVCFTWKVVLYQTQVHIPVRSNTALTCQSVLCARKHTLCVCVWENIILAREHLISDVLFSQSKQSCNQIATVKRSLHWGSDIINYCEGLSFATWHKRFDNLDILCSNSTFKPF